MPGMAAFGAQVGFGSPTVTRVANVTNISGLDGDTEMIDVTSHDSAGRYREKIASFMDAGQVTLEVNFDADEPTHRATAGGILHLRSQGTVVPWTITLPGTPSHKVTFEAFVKSAGLSLPFDDKQGMTVTLEVTGAPVWTYGT